MADGAGGGWRELVLWVDAACLPAQLRHRYGPLYLSHLPLDEEGITAYLSCQRWGTLSFCFRRPGQSKLFRVTLRPC